MRDGARELDSPILGCYGSKMLQFESNPTYDYVCHSQGESTWPMLAQSLGQQQVGITPATIRLSGRKQAQ